MGSTCSKNLRREVWEKIFIQKFEISCFKYLLKIDLEKLFRSEKGSSKLPVIVIL